MSNHGGRAEDNGRSTIEVLPEILVAVDGRIPVLVDSGFRRGTDIAKALAMGATAVCIGRPYLWGLGAFGQEGVERVLQLLAASARRHAAGGRAGAEGPRAGAGEAGVLDLAFGVPSGLEQEPHALLGLIDPVLDQAGAGDVATPVAPSWRMRMCLSSSLLSSRSSASMSCGVT